MSKPIITEDEFLALIEDLDTEEYTELDFSESNCESDYFYTLESGVDDSIDNDIGQLTIINEPYND